MAAETTNWSQSVAGVCLKDGCVLLARHTYGGGAGKLIIPGGYVEYGESPQDALRREFMEETGVTVEPKGLVGIRFNSHDWYAVFEAEYIGGTPRSDGNENSEVLWVPAEEALTREDVPGLTKTMLQSALRGGHFFPTPYAGGKPPCSLYTPLRREESAEEK